MRQLRRKLALILAIMMLVSLLPASVLADKAAKEEESLSYDLGFGKVPVTEFEPDGSFVIEAEKDAFFPYQVRFTRGNEQQDVWFMDPGDSEEVFGHSFRVNSERENPGAFVSMSIEVAGEKLTVYPQEKFDSASVQSLLPLDTHYLDVYLYKYFSTELESIKLETVFAETEFQDNNGNKVDKKPAVYAYSAGRDDLQTDDHYQLIDADTVLNLKDIFYDRYHDRYRADLNNRYRTNDLILIVGTPDQLNKDNICYQIRFYMDGSSEDQYRAVRDFGARISSADHKTVRIYEAVSYSCFDDDKREEYNFLRYYVDGAASGDGELSLALDPTEFVEASGLKLEAYEGYLTDKADLAKAKNISGEILSQEKFPASGGIKLKDSKIEDLTAITLVFVRGEEPVFVLPLMVEINRLGKGILYTDKSVQELLFHGNSEDNSLWSFLFDSKNLGEWAESTGDIHHYVYQEGTRKETLRNFNLVFFDPDYIYSNYGNYYADDEQIGNPVIVRNVLDRSNSDLAMDYGADALETAVVGSFDSAMQTRSRQSVKDALFSNSGLQREYSEDTTFTVLDRDGKLYHFTITTEDVFSGMFVPTVCYEDSPGVRKNVGEADDPVEPDGAENESGEKALAIIPYKYNTKLPLDLPAYLSLTINSWSELTRVKVKAAYEGYFENENSVPANAEDISGMLFTPADVSGGGYPVVLDQPVTFTIVDTDNEFHWVFEYNFTGKGLNGKTSEVKFEKKKETDKATGVPMQVLSLPQGYPADGRYYVSLDVMYIGDPEIRSLDLIDKAVVGYYSSADRIPENAEDIKDSLFTSVYYNEKRFDADNNSAARGDYDMYGERWAEKDVDACGYGADYSKGVIFTVADVYGVTHWFGIKTVGTTWDGSFQYNLYARSSDGTRTKASYYSSRAYDDTNATNYYLLTMDESVNSENNEFFLGLTLSGMNEAGAAQIKRAVAGFYGSSKDVTAAIKDGKAANIAGQLFSNPGAVGAGVKVPASEMI